MQLTKTHKIIISILFLVIIILVGIKVFRKKEKLPNTDQNTNQTISTTTVSGSGIELNTNGTGDYKVEQVPITQQKTSIQIPSLTNKVKFDASLKLSTEQINLVNQKVKDIQTSLSKNTNDFYSWIDLGIYQKMAGDYNSAVLSWKYASAIAPGDYISLGNLADLYAYFIKDSNQAEIYYKKAIVNAPTQASLYVQFSEFYIDVLKDSGKALAVVNTGLSKIPNDANLLQLKASLSK